MARTLSITCRGTGQGVCLVDRGRPGYRDRGIVRGGAADPVAAAAANRLLGQEVDNCCLEITLVGGSWRLSGRGELALTGADMQWQLNGSPVARYCVLYLDGDYLLRGSVARRGCRGYLGIRGQWDVPRVLGSAERGLLGTASISQGFTVTIDADEMADFRNELLPESEPVVQQPLSVETLPGPEWSWLDRRQQDWVLGQDFRVGTQSDRQGIRLVSVWAVAWEFPSLLSSPVLPGTVQLTPSGPILLGPDAHTVGGYPRILQAVDCHPAFQLRPGERLRFTDQTVRS